MSIEWTDDKRIINVSNRLPVKIHSDNGTLHFKRSEGGLATGLSSIFSDCKNIWIGWPGAVVADDQRDEISKELTDKSLHPVFLTQSEIDNYYEGFSNGTLWPLFHYFPTYSKYDKTYWDEYVSVNKKFADEIIRYATSDDMVWIHDYQLMLVPAMVRKALPGITIGYFQHIPFPDFEIFRALPWKTEILEGLLGADTIGFQTEDDTQHFITTAAKILGIKADYNQLNIDNRNISVQAFPIGIDFAKFRELATEEETDRNAEELTRLINTKLAISVDRLDYSKGIIQRLQAFDLFLEQHPEWREKITLLHLVVPSRDNVSSYKDLKEEMNRLISNINGKHSTFGWQPVRHFYRSLPPNMLSALYRTADIALVTPLRDGMNLVSKEYVAGNINMNGVLLLGEAAGAAKELTEALILNPNDIQQFADKINEALNMSDPEKKSRMARMQEKIKRSDIFMWANSFLGKLKSTINKQKLKVCTPVDETVIRKFDKQYAFARKRLLLLDYDGTLVPFFKRTEDAIPDEELLQLLRDLSADKRNNVVIISGRDKITLDKWLGHLQIDIVGEHGAWFREYGKKWYSVPGLSVDWKNDVREVMNAFVHNTPGTFIEDKGYSLAWHYRAADERLSEKQASALMARLGEQYKDRMVDVIDGNKVVEVKCSKVNKGKAALSIIARQEYDFILAIGDDQTDEDMFKVMPENSFSVKVSSNISAATYFQRSYTDVRALLSRFTLRIPSPDIVRFVVNKAS